MAKHLEDISTEELQAEIERRERETKAPPPPKPLPDPDFGPVTELCQNYIDELAETGYRDANYENWMFETAMEAVFGRDVWEWTHPILRGEGEENKWLKRNCSND